MFSNLKILRHPERLAEWMRRGHTSVPIGVDLHLTDFCPHKCPHCNGKPNGSTMDYGDAARIVQELAGLGCKAIHFVGGGEPLAHKECVNLAELAVFHGMSVGLLTNLYRLPDVERMREAFTWIRVSLDAIDVEGYRQKHGVDTFEEVCENIQTLTNGKADCDVGIGYLVNNENKHEMSSAVILAKKLGTKYIQFRPMDGCKLKIADEQLRLFRCLSTKTFEVSVPDAKFRPTRKYTECHGCHFWTLIRANMDVEVCCQTLQPCTIGNLRDCTFDALWRTADISIDLAKCPVTCRMAANNELLNQIARPIEHEAHI